MRFPLDTAKTRSCELTARLAVIATALLAVPLMGADCSIQELAESLEKACESDLLVTTIDEDRDPSQPDAFFVCQPDVCTLRDAIATANACGGSHTIVVSSHLYGLSSPERNSMHTAGASTTHDALDGPVGLPVITADIRIYAEDGDAVIVRDEDAEPFRIFHVAGGASLELDHVSVALGLTPNDGSGDRRQDGGGILNDGFLSLEHSALVRNKAFRLGGAVANYGELRAAGSAFLQNLVDVPDWLPEEFGGGALFNGSSSTASFEETHFYFNLAGTTGHGGAVVNRGELELVRSILAENGAAMNGGAIYSPFGNVRITRSTLTGNGTGVEGGALYAGENAEDVWIHVSTLSANYADEGGALSYFGMGELSIEDSTIVHNSTHPAGGSPEGAAVDVGSGSGHVLNTIIANQPGLMGSPIPYTGSTIDCRIDGAILFPGPGIDSDGSCAPHFDTTDPGLRPLADNYGFTPTHALEPWSAALDTGSYCRTLDQRDLPRPRDGDGNGDAACDIGAVEAQPGEIHLESGIPFDPLVWLSRDFRVATDEIPVAEEL